MGSAVNWTWAGPFSIVSSDAATCTLKATSNDGTSGGIIVVFAGGGAVSKPITASCGRGGGDESSLDDFVSVYPNPVADVLNIEIDAAAHVLDL